MAGNPYIEGAGATLQAAGSIYGAIEGSQFAKQKADEEKAIAQLEMQADQQRRQAMEISARRQQVQTVRNAQQARATALSASVNQGAQFSTGAQGGQQGVTSQGNFANLGVSQNLQIGENLFNINSAIDATKIAEADTESKQATAL